MKDILIFLSILGCLATGAEARDLGQWEAVDPEIREWYQALMQPDVPNASCCGEADAYWADEVHVRDGKTYAIITDDRPDEPRGRPHIDFGTEIEIPNNKLKWDKSNPTGHGIVFLSRKGYVLRSAWRRLIAKSTGRNMRAAARPWLVAAFVDRHVAIIDSLLIHPFPAEPFLSGQHARCIPR